MLEKLRYQLNIFFRYAFFSLKIVLRSRLGVLFFLSGKILRFLFFFFLISFVFNRVRIIKGYTINQAIIFYLTFNLIDTASQILFREVYRFKYQVVSGSFNLILTKPHHPFLQILVGGVDFLDLLIFFPYLLLTIYFIIKLPAGSINPNNLFLYLLLFFNGLLLTTAFHIAVLAFGVLTTEVDNTIMIYRDITNVGRFPLDIYQSPVREILTFVIPVAVMVSFPAQALFNLLTLPKIIYGLVVSGLFFLLSLRFWNYSLKKYQSWGG